MKNPMQVIADTGVLPVINVSDVNTALPLVDALSRGGLNAIEVTLRSEGSLESIRKISAERPDFVVGAGTVLSVETAQKALDAGASFIVSPGYDVEVLNFCNAKGVPYVPGCTSATEIQTAVKAGLKVIKFFPAELSGGLPAITLLSGPFPGVKFVPTGGITYDNLGTYLKSGKIAACGGSFMASADLIKAGKFDEIEANARKALRISLGFELAHVGINNTSAEEARANVDAIDQAFMLDPVVHSSCTFAGKAVESMNTKGAGTLGHVGFYTNSIERALAYYKKQGIAVDEEHIKRDDKGIVAVYLKDEIGGFAFHIVRR